VGNDALLSAIIPVRRVLLLSGVKASTKQREDADHDNANNSGFNFHGRRLVSSLLIEDLDFAKLIATPT
jgi:hypothetical protein